jgi:hypothetical protein
MAERIQQAKSGQKKESSSICGPRESHKASNLWDKVTFLENAAARDQSAAILPQQAFQSLEKDATASFPSVGKYKVGQN